MPAEGHVAEDQDVDDRRVEHAVADRRPDLRQPDEARRSARSARPTRRARPSARCAAIGAKMSRPWKLDVMSGSIRPRFSSARASTMPAERLGRVHQQPVVRTDEDVAAGDPERDRQALRADARVDDGDVDPDRHVRQGEDERAGPVADRVPRHLVVDVDDVRVRADPEHDRRGRRPAPTGRSRSRKVMTGRIGGWYRTRRTVAPGRAEAAPGGGSAPLRTVDRSGGGGRAVAIGWMSEVSAVGAVPRRRDPNRPVRAMLAQEQQLIDLAEGPVDLRDRDAAQEGGQVGGLVRREAPAHEEAIGRAGHQLSAVSSARLSVERRGARPGRGRGATPPWMPPPRDGADEAGGEAIARVPVNLAAPARPCPTVSPRALVSGRGRSGAVGACWSPGWSGRR